MSARHVIKFIQSDADCWLCGVNQRIFILQVESPSFFLIRVNQKTPKRQGGKSLLTLFFITFTKYLYYFYCCKSINIVLNDVLVSLDQLLGTMHIICKIYSSNFNHHFKKKKILATIGVLVSIEELEIFVLLLLLQVL